MNLRDKKALETAHAAFQEGWPIFYDLVSDFPDFQLEPGLTDAEIANLEEINEFEFRPALRKLLSACSGLSMNGLKMRANELAVIQLPDTPALLLGYLNLGHAADRLLMLPGGDAICYLEQHNGAITKIAPSLDALFNEVLPRRLYG